MIDWINNNGHYPVLRYDSYQYRKTHMFMADNRSLLCVAIFVYCIYDINEILCDMKGAEFVRDRWKIDLRVWYLWVFGYFNIPDALKGCIK